ncbi:hypothetical protein B4113_2815 [Geobacillus sp. B4113_201601]|nr:hypothetical protein B4113_2815 [Geobacillus sp. B4113_201601]
MSFQSPARTFSFSFPDALMDRRTLTDSAFSVAENLGSSRKDVLDFLKKHDIISPD